MWQVYMAQDKKENSHGYSYFWNCQLINLWQVIEPLRAFLVSTEHTIVMVSPKAACRLLGWLSVATEKILALTFSLPLSALHFQESSHYLF